jgi:hypothetical protein
MTTDVTTAPDVAGPADSAQLPPAVAADTPAPAAPDAADDLELDEESGEPVEADIEIEVPQEIYDLRNSQERLLFSAQAEHAQAILDKDFASPDLAPELQQAVAAEAREILADLGLSRSEGLELRSAIVNHDPAVPSAQAWDSMTALLNREFGMNATEAFDRARALVQRDPRVEQILAANGLGNNPKIVLQIARAAMRNRGR